MRTPTPNEDALPWLVRWSGAADCGASACRPSALNNWPVSSSEKPTEKLGETRADTVGAIVSCWIVVVALPLPHSRLPR
ncbi:hypothetical protein AWV79_31365 [Cupriavidus sp. UYMMa02A]|nr:hypothetical protein AWV79_31365 [Cupriavidus sp. UYMMa02A]